MIRERFCSHLSLLTLFAAMMFGGVLAQSGQPEKNTKLQQWLKKFPAADLNGDGVLTENEAREFQNSRKQGKASQKPEAAGKYPPPAFADVSYGPHERNKLDFWRAGSNQPTPVLVFFHGGSFKAGDKSSVQARPVFEECLKAGISVVSANYRFSTDAPFPAPMQDGARAVQFIRSRAREWNIDPTRLAVSGSSAGATLALWIALHDDLADPSGKDPVSRLSTRVTCASPHSGPASLEPEYFRKHAGVSHLGSAIYQLFGAASQEELQSPAKHALVREASPLLHATANDPPLFLTYAGDPSEAPFAPESAQSAWIHHVSLGLPLKARYDELSLECEIYYHSRPQPARAEIGFLIKHLLREAKTPEQSTVAINKVNLPNTIPDLP